MLLHDYWRSTASYRVRIALGIKGLRYRQVAHDLRTDAQHDAAYRVVSPQGLVPALEAFGDSFIQSSAILEWLEERYPSRPLLPAHPTDRAVVRSMAALIGCDIHPINNLRVLKALRTVFEASEAQVSAWIARWTTEGFDALEILIDRHGAGFAYGAEPTLADCYLVPQAYSAERFGVDLSPYPHLMNATEAARALPAFAAAHPSLQPDADAP